MSTRALERRRDGTAYVGMVVFLGGWAMLFAALFFAYATVRTRAPVWPPDGDVHLPLGLPALSTLVLAASSVALALGERALRRDRAQAVAPSLLVTILLGTLFLLVQLTVWRRVWLNGLQPSTDIYGSVFYALTTFHALHVLVGLVGLALLLPRALDHRLPSTSLKLWAMYWHFVGLVWLVMFASVYAC